MKTIKYLIMLVCMTFVSISLFAQEKELQTESDGFKWYQLYQDGKYGAQSINGTTIIPLSRGYSFIFYHSTDGGYFSVNKNGKWGVCNKNGKEIILPQFDWIGDYSLEEEGIFYVELNDKEGVYDKNGREIIAPKYDKVCKHESDGFYYFGIKLNEKKGACDMNGREIIAPKYKFLIYSGSVFKYTEEDDALDPSTKWISTGISLEKNSTSTYASNTSSSGGGSSYSSSTASSGNGESSLLYEGEYTIQYSQSRDLINGYSTGQYSSDETERVKIYEDHLAIHFGTHCKYKSTNSSGERVYEGSESIGGTVTAYVSPSYNIRLVNESWFNGMHMKVGIPVVKGRSLMPESSGGYGGGKSSGYQPSGKNSGSKGTNSSSHQVKKPHADYKDCHICHGSGVCSTCGGKGWYNNPYGTGRVECSNCSKTGKCRTCNGTGKVLGPTKWD